MTEAKHYDVIVVGAGLSGICAGYHLQKTCPTKTYAILEAREALGGTWDLFRYPGIRSDSDMYTLGFSFKPWKNAQAIADGPAILEYLNETAAENGIDEKIRFNTRVRRVEWSSEKQQWTVVSKVKGKRALQRLTCNYLIGCSGYYRYDGAYQPDFVGQDDFQGTIVHPQFWDESLDYANKRVVVIGSGATAVTLVPEMAKTAAHVTMLQRSPTYVVSMPQVDTKAERLKKLLPEKVAYELIRAKNVMYQLLTYQLARRAPGFVAKNLVGEVKAAMKDGYDVEKHFTPSYDPWDQRVCMVPDGDLFVAINEGRASVVTDHIERFTATGIRLKSGAEIPADIIVTATGLELQLMGGGTLSVDGEDVNPGERLLYKGSMMNDVPNAVLCTGYTNASWTLKAELSIEYVCRLINYMDHRGYGVFCPRLNDPTVKRLPVVDFKSGYIQRAIGTVPWQGDRAPWRLHQNYLLDRRMFRHTKLEDGVLEFTAAQ